MMRRFVAFLPLLLATAAAAQQRPIYDPDDFVDPRQHDKPVFISRLVLAGVSGFIDDYRALRKNAAFLHLTNSLYYNQWQFAYKHTEPHADMPPVYRCDCQPPIYFPTPPPIDAIPNPPPPGSRRTLQVGWYQWVDRGEIEPPYTLRYRLTFSRERTGSDLLSPTTGQVIDHRSGHEQSLGLEADVHLPIPEHDIWGSLSYARTWSSGTIANRSQQEFVYTARPPGWSMGPVLARTTLTVGGVTNRGRTALNVVNPALEAFWRHDSSRVNVHLVWSPQAMRDGQSGWTTHNQIAFYVDRALFVYLFH